jgi:hypothetical protein
MDHFAGLDVSVKERSARTARSGVVLVRLWIPEIYEHAVTHILRDEAPLLGVQRRTGNLQKAAIGGHLLDLSPNNLWVSSSRRFPGIRQFYREFCHSGAPRTNFDARYGCAAAIFRAIP